MVTIGQNSRNYLVTRYELNKSVPINFDYSPHLKPRNTVLSSVDSIFTIHSTSRFSRKK